MPKAKSNFFRDMRQQDSHTLASRLDPSVQHRPDGTTVLWPSGMSSPLFLRRATIKLAPAGPYAEHAVDVHFTNDPAAVTAFVTEHISTPGITHVGFDLEHRPTFVQGRKPNVSLLQFAPLDPSSTERRTHPVLVFSLFHANAAVPPELAFLLRDPEVVKTGVGINADRQKLEFLGLDDRARQAFVDVHETGRLKQAAMQAAREQQIRGPPNHKQGLKALTERYMGAEVAGYKSKRLTMTNWEKLELADDELRYAALDAFCGVEVWRLIRDADAALVAKAAAAES